MYIPAPQKNCPAGKRTYKQTTSLPVGSDTWIISGWYMSSKLPANQFRKWDVYTKPVCVSSERRELLLYWEYTWSSQSVQNLLFKNTLESFEISWTLVSMSFFFTLTTCYFVCFFSLHLLCLVVLIFPWWCPMTLRTITVSCTVSGNIYSQFEKTWLGIIHDAVQWED